MAGATGPRTGWAVRSAIIGAALVISGPLLRPSGYVLRYDAVAVPEQDLLPWMWGAGTAPPRAVPQDALVAVLDDVVPGWVLQRLLLLGALLLLGFGVARMMPTSAQVAQAGAAMTAMWSPFAYERMAIGHWGLLLGLAVLPWVLRAASDLRAGVAGAPARLIGWVALGSLVPSAGALQVLSVFTVLAWPGRCALRPRVAAVGGTIAVQLVWVIPGLMNPGSSDEQAAEFFGLRAEGHAGPVLTALGTGGIWNSSVMPASRETLLSVLAPVVLLALATAGAPRIRSCGSVPVGPLALMSAVGLVWAVSTALPPLLDVVAAVESLPGGGLLRDAHKWLAPWLVLVSIAAGLGLARAVDALPSGDARGPGALLALLVPVVLLPDLAFGMWGRLQPVDYPEDWALVRQHLASASEPGDVVSWPWSSFRAYPWNARRTVLDPATRYLPRTVVTDSRLLIGRPGEVVVLPSDDPRSTSVAAALAGPDPAAGLLEEGIAWILVQTGQPATPGFPVALPRNLSMRSRVVVATPTLELRQIRGDPREPDPAPAAPLIVAWALWAAALGTACAAGVRLGLRGGSPAPG